VAQLSSLPTGLTTNGQEKRIVVMADVCLAGEKRPLRALIDNGAQLNLISQKAVRDLDLEGSDVLRPVAKYLNDQRLQLHRAHDFKLSVANMADTHRRGTQRF
jgi:hypothetical protein